MLWDSDRPIQEYSDTHVFTTVYDQASFAPVARLAWLREETINEQVSEQDKDWLTKFNDKERETRVNLREIPSFYDDYVKKDKLEAILGIKVYYYHNDQLGTPNELTNEKGEVIWLADLAAWGNVSKEEYQSQAIGDFEISAEDLQPVRFQGQFYDNETGLHYNRFRYYDSDKGMFISRDPIGLMGGDNVFAYAPNPTGWIDPLGLTTWKIVGFEKRIKSLPSEVPFNTKPIYLETSPPKSSLINIFFDGFSAGAEVGLMSDASMCVATVTRTGKRATSVYNKLDKYALNPKHPVGMHKARVFKSALGYDETNVLDLSKQIFKNFDIKKLEATQMTQYGQKYNQVMSITGPNGKTTDVVTGWIKNEDNVIRLTTTFVKKRNKE